VEDVERKPPLRGLLTLTAVLLLLLHQWISFFNYLNTAIVKNEFEGLELPGGLSGDEEIDVLNLPDLSVAVNLLIIVAMIVFFRLTAFFFVKKNYMPPKFVLPPQKEDDSLEVIVPHHSKETMQ